MITRSGKIIKMSEHGDIDNENVPSVNDILCSLKTMIENLTVSFNEQTNRFNEKLRDNQCRINVLENQLASFQNRDPITLTNNAPQNNHVAANEHNLHHFKLKELVPKFNDRTNNNPVEFLKSLERVVHQTSNRQYLSNIIRSSLEGNAQEWFTIVEHKFGSFNEFKELFLNKYWSELTQNKIRTDLFNGRYNPFFGTPREIYFTKRYANTQHVIPKINEDELIKFYSRHFQYDIVKAVITQRIRTYSDFCELLREYDDLDKYNSSKLNVENRFMYPGVQNIRNYSELQREQNIHNQQGQIDIRNDNNFDQSNFRQPNRPVNVNHIQKQQINRQPSHIQHSNIQKQQPWQNHNSSNVQHVQQTQQQNYTPRNFRYNNSKQQTSLNTLEYQPCQSDNNSENHNSTDHFLEERIQPAEINS